MACGLSLHIGVNSPPGQTPLQTCVNDAIAMRDIALAKGFEATLLPEGSVTTRTAIAGKIMAAAGRLRPGDIYFVSFSGHGGQVQDVDGDEAPNIGGDGFDETWCCSDDALVDDDLAKLWSTFSPGVRILVISDSCNSGTVTRTHLSKGRRRSGTGLRDRVRTSPIGANGLLMGACRDGATASAAGSSGLSLFTSVLVATWQKIIDSHSKADYREFYSRINRALHGKQTPSWYPFGSVDDSFHLEPPFSIEHTIALPTARGTRARKQGDQHR